jgi:integrase
MIRNLVRRHFNPTITRAKLPASIRLYDLRHSCAALLLMTDENPKVVSERLGHSTIVLTLDTYSHVLPTMQQGATTRLEKMLYNKGSSSQ